MKRFNKKKIIFLINTPQQSQFFPIQLHSPNYKAYKRASQKARILLLQKKHPSTKSYHVDDKGKGGNINKDQDAELATPNAPQLQSCAAEIYAKEAH